MPRQTKKSSKLQWRSLRSSSLCYYQLQYRPPHGTIIRIYFKNILQKKSQVSTARTRRIGKEKCKPFLYPWSLKDLLIYLETPSIRQDPPRILAWAGITTFITPQRAQAFQPCSSDNG